MILKKDNLKLGLILGLVLPILVFLGIYLIRFGGYPFSEFLSILSQESRLLTFFSAWCLVANIALFTLYINSNKYNTAKGIFAITIFYGLGFLLLKILN